MKGKVYCEVILVDELRYLVEDVGKFVEEIVVIIDLKVEFKFMVDGVKLLSE